MARGFEEGLSPGFSGGGEIAFRTRQLHGNKFVTEAAKFSETCGDFELRGGRGRRKDGYFGAFAKCLGLARCSKRKTHARRPSVGISSVTTPWRLSLLTI